MSEEMEALVGPAVASSSTGTNNYRHSATDMASGFSRMCRACATCTDCLVPIFHGEGLLNNLPEKIQKHLPIKVSEWDRLPQQLCRQCADTLLAWHELVKCCSQADAALRTRLQRLQELHPKNLLTTTTDAAIETVDSKNNVKRVGPESPELGRRGVCAGGSGVGAGAGRRHRCAACGAAFSDAGNLSRHARAVHAAERPHACAACPARFTRRAHLREHAATHAPERRYVCDACGRTSKSAAALRAHRRVHERVYRFACAACGKPFKRRQELVAHASVHTGERAHACAACGRAFRLRSQMLRHARIHHHHHTAADAPSATSSHTV